MGTPLGTKNFIKFMPCLIIPIRVTAMNMDLQDQKLL